MSVTVRVICLVLLAAGVLYLPRANSMTMGVLLILLAGLLYAIARQLGPPRD